MLLGCGGVVALLTGLNNIGYSFKTGHWFFTTEGASSTAVRIIGAVSIGLAIFLARYKRHEKTSHK
jgi:hypothetical protein